MGVEPKRPNKPIAKLLHAAGLDLDAATRLLAEPPNDLAANHLQQAAEKILAAVHARRLRHDRARCDGEDRRRQVRHRRRARRERYAQEHRVIQVDLAAKCFGHALGRRTNQLERAQHRPVGRDHLILVLGHAHSVLTIDGSSSISRQDASSFARSAPRRIGESMGLSGAAILVGCGPVRVGVRRQEFAS
jgi:hypothetical protein